MTNPSNTLAELALRFIRAKGDEELIAASEAYIKCLTANLDTILTALRAHEAAQQEKG